MCSSDVIFGDPLWLSAVGQKSEFENLSITSYATLLVSLKFFRNYITEGNQQQIRLQINYLCYLPLLLCINARLQNKSQFLAICPGLPSIIGNKLLLLFL
jgi:hypothetical protein